MAVVVAISMGDSVVLLRRAQKDRAHGSWILPGGYINRGETVEAAARREVKEEVGLEVALNGLLGVYSYEGNPVIVIALEAGVLAGDLEGEPREALDVRSFAAPEIPWDELGFRSTRDVLQEFLDRGLMT